MWVHDANKQRVTLKLEDSGLSGPCWTNCSLQCFLLQILALNNKVMIVQHWRYVQVNYKPSRGTHVEVSNISFCLRWSSQMQRDREKPEVKHIQIEMLMVLVLGFDVV